MLRFLTDEDFDGRLTNALLSRVGALDLVRVQDIGLMHTPDPDILAWAAAEGRIVLTLDRNTMTGFASVRIKAGQPMPGVVVVDRQARPSRALTDAGSDGGGQRHGRVAGSDHLCPAVTGFGKS
jgi:predicted nuclease of predicted toxin-antitoxin system